MNLNELIERLESMDPARVLPRGFTCPHSHRGDYSQLAFVRAPDMSVGAMLADARSAVGATYTGWKGGEWKMSKWTDVHLVDEPRDTGEPLTEDFFEAQDAFLAGLAQGRAEERERIVAWLRSAKETRVHTTALAHRIESGDHARLTPPGSIDE